jgi:hypothetical protein
MGCHGSILSHSLGSVARPITQALIERDHETVARNSPRHTSIGVPSSGAVSIGSPSEDDSVTEIIVRSGFLAGLLTSIWAWLHIRSEPYNQGYPRSHRDSVQGALRSFRSDIAAEPPDRLAQLMERLAKLSNRRGEQEQDGEAFTSSPLAPLA